MLLIKPLNFSHYYFIILKIIHNPQNNLLARLTLYRIILHSVSLTDDLSKFNCQGCHNTEFCTLTLLTILHRVTLAFCILSVLTFCALSPSHLEDFLVLLKDVGMDKLWMSYPYFIHILSILYPSSIHSLSKSTLYPRIIHKKLTTSTVYPCIISKTSIVYQMDKVWINLGDY